MKLSSHNNTDYPQMYTKRIQHFLESFDRSVVQIVQEYVPEAPICYGRLSGCF